MPAGLSVMVQNLTAMDDISTNNEADRFAHIMVGDENTDSTAGQMTHELLDIRNGYRIDTGTRLGMQHEIWARCKRACNFQTAVLTNGKRNGGRLAQMRDVKFLQLRIEFGSAPGADLLYHLQHGLDIVFDRKAAENRSFLRQIADTEARAVIHGHRRHVETVNLDGTAIGGNKGL